MGYKNQLAPTTRESLKTFKIVITGAALTWVLGTFIDLFLSSEPGDKLTALATITTGCLAILAALLTIRQMQSESRVSEFYHFKNSLEKITEKILETESKNTTFKNEYLDINTFNTLYIKDKRHGIPFINKEEIRKEIENLIKLKELIIEIEKFKEIHRPLNRDRKIEFFERLEKMSAIIAHSKNTNKTITITNLNHKTFTETRPANRQAKETKIHFLDISTLQAYGLILTKVKLFSRIIDEANNSEDNEIIKLKEELRLIPNDIKIPPEGDIIKEICANY